jgi:aromatic ring-opening dioxygenase LigB subunit
LPHGDAAWDPSLYDDNDNRTRDAAQSIATAARQASAWFTSNSIDLDVILVVSPHGVALSNDFGIFLNTQASGSVEMGWDRKNSSSYAYVVDLPPVELAFNYASDLVQHLSVDQNVSGLQFPESPVIPVLRWAEVIPLLLLQERSSSIFSEQPQQNSRKQRRYIIWTQPLRRHEQSVAMIPELLQLGHHVRQWMDTAFPKVRWGVLVSGDLSHRHTADGPYGVDPVASRHLDAAIGAWASKDVCDQAWQLLDTAAAWQDRGMSCGFTGFVLLHGILCGGSDRRRTATTTSSSSSQQPPQPMTTSWRSQVLVNRNVTYFGMMVANFSCQDGSTSTTSVV